MCFVFMRLALCLAEAFFKCKYVRKFFWAVKRWTVDIIHSFWPPDIWITFLYLRNLPSCDTKILLPSLKHKTSDTYFPTFLTVKPLACYLCSVSQMRWFFPIPLPWLSISNKNKQVLHRLHSGEGGNGGICCDLSNNTHGLGSQVLVMQTGVSVPRFSGHSAGWLGTDSSSAAAKKTLFFSSLAVESMSYWTSFLKSFLFQLTKFGFPGLQLRTLTDIVGDLKGELSMRVRYSVACTTR